MRVLIAEDDPISRHLLKATLTKWGYEVLAAEDGQQAWEMFQQPGAPNLAVLDWMMPGIDGLEVCRRVRAAGRDQYVYILLLTAKGTRENVVEGMEAGADDYVVKPFDAEELKVRLRAARRILDLEARLLDSQRQLLVQATHDGLTGLLNRMAIMESLRRELERSRREGRGLCVAVVDMDKFKAINDTYGHNAGDVVLVEVARRMQTHVRPYDFVGRYGGDEFLIVLSGCGLDEGKGLVERICQAVSADAVDVDGVAVGVTISVGLAALDPVEQVDAELAIQRADKVMYQAKSAGRNQLAAAG